MYNYSIILCGGSGTRLWPLSRKNFPKQFLKLYSDKTLLQETFLRMKEVVPETNIYFVTNEENYSNVFDQIREFYADFSKEQIITEPKSLNTMPAITLAAKYLKDKIGIDVSAPIIVVPADHYIGNKETYVEVAKKALAEIGDNLGTIGIKPTMAHTGLGYIKKGEKMEDFYKVEGFKEKPDEKTAQEFLDSGQYLWNAGMYLFNIGTFSEEIKKYAPEIHTLFEKDMDVFLQEFSTLPAIAIDYAISEKSDRMVTFEGDFDWSDIGSFDVLAKIVKKDNNKRHIAIDSKNIFVHSDSNLVVVTIGVDDLNIVETAEGILVQKQGRSEGIKSAVAEMQKRDLE